MKKKNVSNQASTRGDIDRIEKSLRIRFKNLREEVLKVEARVENIEDGQKRLETKVDNLEIKLDGFVGGVELLKQENSVGVKHTRELRVQVDNHESRTTTLESI